MIFKEMSYEEQEAFIIKNLSTAIKVCKALPKVGPKTSKGIFANTPSKSIWDTVESEDLHKSSLSTEDCTMYDEVVCKWWRAFIRKDGSMNRLWRKTWIIFDESIPLFKKEDRLRCKKSYIYKLKRQSIEMIRRFLIKGGNNGAF